MDRFFVALGVVTILLGAYGIFFAATRRKALGNPVTRFLFSVHGREPERAFTALSSGALIALGAYLLLSDMRPELPRWPSFVAALTFFALHVSAHLQRTDV